MAEQNLFDSTACRRKDFRLLFDENRPLFADCLTKDESFRERVLNLSSKGAFLATPRKFAIGDEIAMTIPLAHAKVTIRATSEVIRLQPEGVGVEFKVIFNF